MNRRRAKPSRLRHRLAILVAGAMSAAHPALPSSVAEETSVLRLPISSRLTAQPPAASLRLSARRLPEDSTSGDSVATATEPATSDPAATKPDATKPDATKPDATKPDATAPAASDLAATELAANNSSDTPSPASTAAQSPVDTQANSPASTASQLRDVSATQSSAVISIDSSAGNRVGFPFSARTNLSETRPEANTGAKARTGVETTAAAGEPSVLRTTPPERLPKVTSSEAVTQPSPPMRTRATPVRLPPVESSDTLTYGVYQRSPVRVGSETIPAPAAGGGAAPSFSRSPVPAPYRLPPPQASPTRLPSTATLPTGLTASPSSSPLGGTQPGTPAAPEAESSDWMSSRWHRFRSQAQHDFWGYPEYFCERPMGLPNQLAYQAMVDNARDDILVFHQFDFHDGQVESAANLNTAGSRRIDRVAELLARQDGGSTVIVEFVPDEPRLTDARREQVAAQLGR
ncbi:MAG: hypothetical protein ACKO38_08135, partial [Planctomycetota bacterium]